MNQTSNNTPDAAPENQQHRPRFVHPGYGPGCFPGMPLASIFAVRMLLLYAAVAFVTASHSIWGLSIGAALLVASIVVASRYGVSFRSIFRRSADDDLHKLHSSRNG